MPCNSYLQGGLIKNKGGVGLFQISQKERLFHLLWQPGTLGGNLIMRSSFLHPSKKPSSLLQLGQEENVPQHSTERRTYWFILKIARMFPIPLSRNRMMSSFIIVNIIPSPQRQDYAFPHSKKSFLLPSVLQGTEYTWTLIWRA